MPSNDLCFLGACEQEQLIRSKKISVTQLITAHLDQVERFNPKLNAIVTLTAESALQAAKEADAQLARQDVIGAYPSTKTIFLRLTPCPWSGRKMPERLV
jgi:Asp-tRNA(Asn)/Glu-tRNA(Gln) amidotransferase A subunit family amidase